MRLSRIHFAPRTQPMDRHLKRHRTRCITNSYNPGNQLGSSFFAQNPDHRPGFEDIISFLPLHDAQPSTANSAEISRSVKRVRVDAFGRDEHLSPTYASEYPSFYPEVPSFAERVVNLGAENPFIDDPNTAIVHPRLVTRFVPEPAPARLEVNAFIKVRFNISGKTKKKQKPLEATIPLRMMSTTVQQYADLPQPSTAQPVALLPQDFGGPAFSDDTDRSLFHFFRTSLCRGRTNVKSDNAYQFEIAPMADVSPLIQHAILSLSATYVIDFQTSPWLEEKAQHHYVSALKLLGRELNMLENYSPGREEALVAALMLLSHNEVINWEVDTHQRTPKWYRSGKIAEYILEKSDPAYRYYSSANVQCSRARFALGQLFCLDNVMSDCVFPLDLDAKKCGFTWLLHGDEIQNRKIVGMTGLSPQLMHYFAKITFLSARLSKDPSHELSHEVAKAIEKILFNFWQWSEITLPGYSSSQALLESCNLDEHGKVTTHSEVTNLIAECYVAAAQIYLQCRALRRPRQHESVQMILMRLLKCIQWQPTSGDLFTAQTPLFAVFVAGIVAYKSEHRAVIREWFAPICEESRGNVKPAFQAMELIWQWADEAQPVYEEASGAAADGVPLGETPAWWEDMVEQLTVKTGRLNLA